MYESRIKSLNVAIVLSLAAVFVSLSLIITPLVSASNVPIGGPSDCDNNAIIRCGVHSVGQLMDDYQGSAYVRAVYSAFGISNADIANLRQTAEVGTVTKQGEVLVNGQVVARQAMTGGRQNIAGSTAVNVNGAKFFKRPPSVSFLSSSLPAFVAMSDGRFQFAVIASCGNAVSGTPTTPPGSSSRSRSFTSTRRGSSRR